jgi:glycosyl transferase family 2
MSRDPRHSTIAASTTAEVHHAAERPELSVIIVTPSRYDIIRKTIHHLRGQTIRDRIEVVIAAPSLDGLQLGRSELDGFFGYTVVEVGPIERLAEAKVAAIRVARAPVVAFAEDHCFPDRGWAAALVAAHAAGWAGVGPVIRNANPASAVSWAGLLLHFGRWLEPARAGAVEQLPWHNASFKRELLLAYGDELPRLLAVEVFLQRDLLARGHRLYLEPSATTYHANISRWWPWMRHEFVGGRLFGATRAFRERWSPARRLWQIVGTPLVPVVRLRRALRDMRRCAERRQRLPNAIGAVAVGLVAHALGEAVGYALGVGAAEHWYMDCEVDRARFVAAQDLISLVCV